jgi:hypothetical protein
MLQIKKNNHGCSKSLLEINEICNKVIDYVIQKFSNTTIRMSEEHFDALMCSKIQQVIAYEI